MLAFFLVLYPTHLLAIGLAISVWVYIMDFMSEEKKDTKLIKDISSPSPLQGEGWGEVNSRTPSQPPPYQGGGEYVYSKTNKLITALYMVTDIMDKEEPLRFKLRTLGVEILSDIHSVSPLLANPLSLRERDGVRVNGVRFLDEILSLLDITSTIGMISEMNCSILKKEFNELKQYIQESRQGSTLSLSEFFTEAPPLLNKEGNERRFLKNSPHPNPLLTKERGRENSIGHDKQTDFNTLKQQRRDEITKIVKTFNNGATITDIRISATGLLASCGEKTLQRELVSMVKDGVLEKTGEKRWSRYRLGSRF